MQPRARGQAIIRSKSDDGRSRLADLRLSGSSKLLFPRMADTALNAVLLNTAGGVTGGDRYSLDAIADTDSHLCLTTQAAERVYKSIDGAPGHIRTKLTLAKGARLDWLPQETIFFEGGALRRRLDVEIADDTTLLLVEPIIFGRTAMGETVETGLLDDRIRLTRAGKVIFQDPVRLQSPIQTTLNRPAIANGARAMATVLLASANAEAHLDRMRSQLADITGGVSLIRPDLLFARILAPDGLALRRVLCPLIEDLKGGPLPRTWML